jgi:hypothetical protein
MISIRALVAGAFLVSGLCGLFAQNPPANPPSTSVDPTGKACAVNAVTTYTPSGQFFTCDSTGHYALVPGGIPAGIVSPAKGGTGQDTSASTGVATVSGGAWSVVSIVPNGNTTAASANTASAIVTRDSNGDFAARDVTGRQWLGTGNVQVGAGSQVVWNGRSVISSSANGLIQFFFNDGSTPAATKGASGSIPASPTSTDPTCSAAGDVGKMWVDNTSAVTTHLKVCGEVASNPAWVTVF